jgi:pimeloyl-ACP methyl ester carboxylesterase
LFGHSDGASITLLYAARYHADPDSAFWGWNDICLHASFREWSIENEIEAICCPLLAIQGVDDEYGTLRQVRGIADRVPQTEVVELADCGHSPHRGSPQQVIAKMSRFVQASRLYPSAAGAAKFCAIIFCRYPI